VWALVTFLAGCATERASVAPSAAAGVAPGPAPTRAALLARRFRSIDVGALTADWPKRPDLPKPEAGYEEAAVGASLAPSDGWWCDLLVDRDDPKVLWVRATGTIVGIREYRGPATIVDETGPLVLDPGR
jgi:hypothetical protein